MTGDRKDFLVCIDSDGCAMDTMNTKHMKYFGPILVDCYGFQEIQEEILRRWNTINLYSMTRGINRFLALKLLLEQLQAENLCQIDISSFLKWAEQTEALSNDSLANALAVGHGEALRLALAWSEQVNEAICNADESHSAFSGVEEALKQLQEPADIVVVSSANQEALETEWKEWNDKGYIKGIMSQNNGSKAECIRSLRCGGYQQNHILMIGDAPGDLKAAQENQVYFYPILAGQEEVSWVNFVSTGFRRFLSDTFTEDYQQKLIKEFQCNLEVGDRR